MVCICRIWTNNRSQFAAVVCITSTFLEFIPFSGYMTSETFRPSICIWQCLEGIIHQKDCILFWKTSQLQRRISWKTHTMCIAAYCCTRCVQHWISVLKCLAEICIFIILSANIFLRQHPDAVVTLLWDCWSKNPSPSWKTVIQANQLLPLP